MEPGIKGYKCKVTIPSFGCQLWAENARAFSGYQITGANLVSNNSPATVELHGSRDGLLRGIRQLQETFNADNYKFGDIVEIRFSNLEEELEYLEKTHDRTYMMSEDFRVWRNGETKLNRINELRKVLGMNSYYKDNPLYL